VSRAIADRSRTIRVPVHVSELILRVAHVETTLAPRYGR
jgi:DNA-directed RNA polymerase sigma subunit (sigma70/sigma32)